MLERLRQVAFMVRDLEEGRELYHNTLGLEPCHSEDLSQYGLENMVLPAGNGTFVELLRPTSAGGPGDNPASRFLDRRGEAPYLLIFETKRYDQLIDHLRSLGVRITSESPSAAQPTEGYRSAFIHPSSANGAFLEIIEVSQGSNPWPPAGPDWRVPQPNAKTRQLRQVAVLVRDLDQAIGNWG